MIIYTMIIYITIIQILIFLLLLYKDISKYNISLNLLVDRFIVKNIGRKDILLHGVSCGEINLLNPIIKILEDKKKSYIISVHTPTGYIMGKKFTNKIILKPYECLITSFILFYNVRPKKLIISESDMWPSYLIMSILFRCEVIFINYKIKNKVLRNIYHNLIANKIYLKTKQIIPSYLVNKYDYLGNIKLLSDESKVYNKLPKSIVIASAHLEELEIHLNLIKFLIDDHIIIYLPRNLNYKDELIRNIKNKNLSFKFCEDFNFEMRKINIIWKIGMLNQIYPITKFTIMGGTFNHTGGHNIIEPIRNKNLVYHGPSTHTISDLVNIYKTIPITKDFIEFNYCNETIESNYNLYINSKEKVKKKIYKLL